MHHDPSPAETKAGDEAAGGAPGAPSTPDTRSTDAGSTDSPSLREVTRRLARRLSSEHFPKGALAELRRLDATHRDATVPASFWRLVAEELEHDRPPLSDEELRRWMVILQGLATLAGHGLAKGPKLGRAMAGAGIAESRLTRLLAARDEALHHQVRSLVHLLRSKAQSVDFSDVAALVLSDGHAHALSVRHQVAGDYYRALHHSKKKENRDEA